MLAFSGPMYMTLALSSAIGSLLILKRHTSTGRLYWTSNDTQVELNAPPVLIWAELGALSLISLSTVVGIIVHMLGTRDAWMVLAGLGALGAVGLRYLSPIIRPGGGTRRRISLSKNGVELTRIDGHTDIVPWRAHPRLIGVHQGYAVMALKNHHDLHYPIGYLPISMRQLERLFKTFSSSMAEIKQNRILGVFRDGNDGAGRCRIPACR